MQVVRVIATGATGLFALVIMSWLVILISPQTTSVPVALLFVLARLLVACGVGWLVWKRPADISTPIGLLRAVVIGVVVVGGVGFCGGFFGPIVFAPQSNQGPLLGIFITGPIGCIVGGIGGAVYWGVRRKRGADINASKSEASKSVR